MKTAFNSPLETGVRSLLVLTAQNVECDLQRLLYYDYLMVHSADVPNGPPSVHPGTPHRSGELLVRRRLIEQGLLLMLSRNLLQRNSKSAGFTYSSTKLGERFVSYLSASYVGELQKRTEWLLNTFHSFDDAALADFFDKNLQQWGSEFVEILADDES